MRVQKRGTSVLAGGKTYGGVGHCSWSLGAGVTWMQVIERFSKERGQWEQRHEMRKPGGDYKEQCIALFGAQGS